MLPAKFQPEPGDMLSLTLTLILNITLADLDAMFRWRQFGENTVCSTKENSGDLYSGDKKSMKNPDDCVKLCLTKPDCVFASYWAGEWQYCYLYSAGACPNPTADSSWKGISWKRHRAGSHCRFLSVSTHMQSPRFMPYGSVTHPLLSLTHSFTHPRNLSPATPLTALAPLSLSPSLPSPLTHWTLLLIAILCIQIPGRWYSVKPPLTS